jgi:hypothetical protein
MRASLRVESAARRPEEKRRPQIGRRCMAMRAWGNAIT